jgi:ribosomal protein S18 acetylase RimI-like enzyme
MEFTVRSATQGDNFKIRPLQEEIAKLHFDGRPDLFKSEARYFSDEAFAERLSKPDYFAYIAETSEGEAAGYVFSSVEKYRGHSTYRDFDSFYIDDICVLEKYRRRGIGKALFEKCREKACELKCHNIDLGVWNFNRDAVAFYEKCGMTIRMMRMEIRLE